MLLTIKQSWLKDIPPSRYSSTGGKTAKRIEEKQKVKLGKNITSVSEFRQLISPRNHPVAFFRSQGKPYKGKEIY